MALAGLIVPLGWRLTFLPAYRDDVSRLRPLLTLLDVELDLLPLFQIPESITPDCGEVDEHVRSSLALNESIALASIEPLDGSSFSL